MKKIVIIIFLFFVVSIVNAQEVKPVDWAYKVEKISSDEYELYMLAFIDKHWHLYGQHFEDGGPIQMKFEFLKNENYSLIDSVSETPKPIFERDEFFDIDVQYFTKKVLFKQKVNIKTPIEVIVLITGQACNEKNGMCVMVSDEHVFILK